MALSRLRLRLTGGFAVAMLVAFVALDGAGYAYVTWTNSRDFNERLKDAAATGHSAIQRTAKGWRVDSGVILSMQQALADWRPSRVAFAVYDSTGAIIGRGGDAQMITLIPARHDLPDIGDIDAIPLPGHLHLRVAADTMLGTRIVAAATTNVLRRNQNRFLLRMLLTLPLALLLALAIGYSLTRYALQPIDQLGRAVAAISPVEPVGRLPVHHRADELDQLAVRFNDLLDRIGALQERSHRFLREVAHQIRTPLTLIVGEAELGLERERSNDEYVRTLRRVHAAASQMTHRVHDLLLLARMEAGERPPLRDAVELDTLALEATDLFRARARILGRHLDLAEVAPCEVQGDEALLREALLELLENACRHGDAEAPVAVSVRREQNSVLLEVRNAGPPIPTEPQPPASASGEHTGGLGLSIIRWIASVHGGTLLIARHERDNMVALQLPAGSS